MWDISFFGEIKRKVSTLRFLKLIKIQYRDEIKLDVKKEIHWIKNKQGPNPNFDPIISFEDYRKIN